MTLPNYYAVLNVLPSAGAGEIRDAYKKAALSTHPDRFPAGSAQAAQATKTFQEVNDAYYTLSDAGRRREYDQARQYHQKSWNPFASGTPSADGETRNEEQFANAFEEMLREEGVQEEGSRSRIVGGLYSVVGGVSGATLGFILANVPGAIGGGLLGNRLGAIRDAKGKSVYEVFQDLPQSERARVLADLARKVFAQVS